MSEKPIGFLLSQLGAHSASNFSQAVKPLGITAGEAGIIRLIGRSNSLTQKDLARMLSMLPSRLVLVIDELEAKALVKRTESDEDRRSYHLKLTAAGSKVLVDLREIAKKHTEGLCKGLSVDERNNLAELLSKVASNQGLASGIHPN